MRKPIFIILIATCSLLFLGSLFFAGDGGGDEEVNELVPPGPNWPEQGDIPPHEENLSHKSEKKVGHPDLLPELPPEKPSNKKNPSKKKLVESRLVEEEDPEDVAERILSKADSEEGLFKELEKLGPGYRSSSVAYVVFRSLTGLGPERDVELARSVLDWYVNSGLRPPDDIWVTATDMLTDYGEWEPDNAMDILSDYEGVMEEGYFVHSLETLVEYYFGKHESTEQRVLDVAAKAGFSNESRALLEKIIAKKKAEE